MGIGPDDPTWRKLYDALAKLATESGGTFAFVLDEGNGLWCVGIPNEEATTFTREQDRAADRFYQAEVVPRASALRKGSRLVLSKIDGDDRYAAQSFAGIYVLVVWFEGAFAETFVHARMRRVLPEIEALTLALPPSGGPGRHRGAMKARA
jgi:hypothetical protein